MNESAPNGFQHFVSLYEEVYDAVKEVSPETQVFCVFARESVATRREADLDVLRLFDPAKIDVLAFTSYPHAVEGITHPEEIPDDYYARVFAYFPEKAMGFSELGWPSHEAFGGEQGQANFLIHCAHRLTADQGVDVEFLGWVWLHDLDDTDSLGLKRKDGTGKLAYDVWKAM